MAERPIECSHCQKPLKVIYKEIVGESILITEMCADCPVLKQKLQIAGKGWDESDAGLCCGRCRTSLESIKMGNPVGCSECYSVFSDLLLSELLAADKVPSRLKQSSSTKGPFTHVGKSPGKTATFTPSNRLMALNEALNEALKKENYEQAAWLRDQIKALKEKSNDGKS